MLTHGQSDFMIHYIDPDTRALRSYYPDFLAESSDGKYSIYEVKADYMVDDRVVLAKAEYAGKMALASGMTYTIVKQSEIYSTEKEGAVQQNLIFIEDYKDRKYIDTLPLYSLKAACGKFGEGQSVEPEGWVEVPIRKGMGEGWFVARAIGQSMEPKIPDGSYCIFKPVSAGTKEGKILLIQHHDITDPEHGGKYTLKKYTRSFDSDGTDSQEKTIILQPINPAFDPIILKNGDVDYEEQFLVVGELVDKIY